MIRHLFRLIWNKKKQNSLLIVEMLVSFMVVFALFSSMVYFARNYMQPMGIAYKDVWIVDFENQASFSTADSAMQFYENLRKTLKAMPEVRALSYQSQNVPFTPTMNGTGLKLKGQPHQRINVYKVEDSYRAVYENKLLEGRWLSAQDDPALSKLKHVVISETLREMAFGKGPAIGQTLYAYNGEPYFQVVGVVEDMKDKGSYTKPLPSFYQRMDSGEYRWARKIAVKVSANAGAAFESRLYKTLASSMKQSTIEVSHLDRLLVQIDKFTLVPMIISLIVAGFLIVNVALGLFGVLWYNISQRRGEIGLRRAIGATAGAVSRQLVTESMILSTLALAIGVFFAIQFPLLNVFDIPGIVYMIAILLSVLFIYSLVLICSLYPGRQAAAIYPAVALHAD